MGFAAGELILEVGYGQDCDDVLRSEIVAITGTQLLEGETTEVVDAVILWWRDGHVESSDIQDAAPIAGLSQTSTIALAQDWAGTRLVARKVGKR
jgi:hypothetical protein